MGYTFAVVLSSLVLFRSPNIEVAWAYTQGLARGGSLIELLPIGRYTIEFLPMVGLFLLIEWVSQRQAFPMESSKRQWLKMAAVIGMMVFLGSYSNMQDYIYFMF